ncbi:TcfC E-set like domain-containing protein [Vibrio parahaemolyticus]|nr:TcfC E-set like domain-containing protein [Vibrio parahaemolyticus]
MKIRAPLFVLSLGLSSYGMASESNIVIPNEFSEMFTETESSITLQISGLSSTSTLNVQATPFSVQLSPVSQQKKLAEFLISQHLRESAVKSIVDTMTSGVKNDPLCTGLVANCQLMPEQYAFAYDYERQMVILFVNASLFERDLNAGQPHSSYNQATGIINHFNIDFSYFQNGSSDAYLRDSTVIGLPYGNITSDVYVSTNNDTSIDELAYNYEWDHYRFQVGHYEYGYAQNTTGALDLTGSSSLTAMTFSSSRNLIDLAQQSQRQLTYVLPGQGRIEVYRDKKLVYGRNVPAGSQTVNYKDLPAGNYLATVVVLSQGREVLREQQQIYNTAAFSLGKGEFDYAFTVGQFESRYDNVDANFDELTLSSDAFVDGRLNYQWLDNSLFGARVVATQDHSLIEGFISQEIGEQASMRTQYAAFDNNSTYWSIEGALFGVSLGYEDYTLDNTDYALNNYLLGNTDYRRVSASTGAAFLGGSGYLMYIDNLAQDETLLGENYRDQSSYWSFTAGYSRPFVVGSTLDLSLTWQGGDGEFEQNDRWYASLLWTIPLGNEWRAMSSVSTSQDGIDEFRNSVAKDIAGDNYYVSTEAGVSYNGSGSRDMTMDASLNGRYDGQYASADTYVYTKSDGTQNINVGLSSSQVFDGERLYMTPEKSNAYVVVDANNRGDTDHHVGLMTITTDSSIRHHKNIDKPQTIVPVDEYEQYQVILDTDSSNYIVNDKKEANEYLLPGSVMTLAVDLTKIKTFITSFEDLKENYVDEVQCRGEGCVGVEKLTEGVFKVSVVVGADYQLVSNNQTCITPTLDRQTSKIVNVGINYCLPGVDDDGMQLAELQGVNLDGEDYYFVGVYQNDQTLKQASMEVVSTGLDAITRNVGQHYYLYAKAKAALTIAQREQLDTLWHYAAHTLENDHWVLWR